MLSSQRRHVAIARAAERSPIPVMGALRDDVLAVRAEAEAELAVADHELADAVHRRRVLVDRIVGCNRALTGADVLLDDEGRRIWHARKHRTVPFDDPVPEPSAPAAGEVVRGDVRTVRERCCGYLRAAQAPMTVGELHRLLALDGVSVAGYPPKAIANALRTAERHGSVRRVGRGLYVALPATVD